MAVGLDRLTSNERVMPIICRSPLALVVKEVAVVGEKGAAYREWP